MRAVSAQYEGIVSNRLTMQDIPDFAGMIARNGGRPLLTWLDKLGRVVVGTSRDWILAYKAFAQFAHRIYRKGGVKYLIIYLKACSVLLQQSVGGQRLLATQALGCAVSRTKSGLPRIIPSAHRRRILQRERDVLRVWLSIFSIYRVLEMPGKLKLSTITDAGKEIPNSVWSEVTEFLPIFGSYITKFSPNSVLAKALLCDDLGEFLKENFRAKPFMIAKSSPANEPGFTVGVLPGGKKLNATFQSTSPDSLINAALLFRTDKVMGPLLVQLASWTGNQWMLNRMEEWSRAFVKAGHRTSYPGAKPNLQGLSLGKLGLKEEPAGKVRVFAMVDAWSQWLLRPLHDAIFHVLTRIPQDGTFDQLRPVRALIKEIEERNLFEVFSYDLTAATDRLPLTLQVRVLGLFLGHDYATCWGDFLTRRGYRLYSKEYNVKGTFYYSVGQPMGALSSWAMLALTHHFIVQWAAWRVARAENRVGGWFTLYAVLGDDIVIADASVAKEYLRIMDDLGVGIGLAKSLVSTKRTMEFAKKFFIPEDASLVPFKELVAATRHAGVLTEFGKKYNLSIPDYLHLLGFGYKVKGDLHKPFLKLGLRVRKFLIFVTSPFVSTNFTVQHWFSSLSLLETVDQGQWDRVYQSFRDFSIQRINQMIAKLDERMVVVKHLVQVKRDREYYGVVKGNTELLIYPKGSEEYEGWVHGRYYINYLLGVGSTPDQEGFTAVPQYVVDQIAETVYREAYYDLAVDLRVIKEKLEELSKLPDTEDPFSEFENIWKAVSDMEDLIAEFPAMPSVKYRADPGMPRSPLGRVYSLWSKFNRLLRSETR